LISIHNPDRYMADLRQILSQGRKRIGILIGAGAPTAIRVDEHNRLTELDGHPLIPDIAGLTDAVIDALTEKDRTTIDSLRDEIDEPINIEVILTRVRRLAQVVGDSRIHGLTGNDYEQLGQAICQAIGDKVRVSLPKGPNPFSQLVAWIAGTHRAHAVEIFTPNYDLLIEEAFERARVPYFDGFAGAHQPFFDAAGVSSDELPARWSRVWKLHGSLGWRIVNSLVVRSGGRDTTELIYPDHLKYDQVTRLPYSALFERLRQFVSTPDTLLLSSGFSFRDAHICAILDEALAVNTHTAILAFQHLPITDEEPASELAYARPNMSVYARDGAIISGVGGVWRPGQHANVDWLDIRRTFWRDFKADGSGGFLLGDFNMLAQFLALTQAQQVVSQLPDEESDG